MSPYDPEVHFTKVRQKGERDVLDRHSPLEIEPTAYPSAFGNTVFVLACHFKGEGTAFRKNALWSGGYFSQNFMVTLIIAEHRWKAMGATHVGRFSHTAPELLSSELEVGVQPTYYPKFQEVI